MNSLWNYFSGEKMEILFMLNKRELDEVNNIFKDQSIINKENALIEKNYKIEKITMKLEEDFNKQQKTFIETSALKEQLKNKRLFDDKNETYILSFNDIKPSKHGKVIYLMKDTEDTAIELITLMENVSKGMVDETRTSFYSVSTSNDNVSLSSTFNKLPMEVSLEDIKPSVSIINVKPQMSHANRLSLLSKKAENYFQVEEIAEKFIAEQGIEKLMRHINVLEKQKKKNEITYWFNSMTKLFGFLNALQYITEYEGILQTLYRFFVEYKNQINLQMSVLKIFKHLNTYYYQYEKDNKGYFFDLLWECAEKYALQNNTKPLEELIAPLMEVTETSLGEFSIQCFELVVLMMEKSKGKTHVKEIKEKLYKSGLKEALDKLVMRDSQPDKLKDLIEKYSEITKEELQGTEYAKKKL